MRSTPPLCSLLALLALAVPGRAEGWTRLAGHCSGITDGRAVVVQDAAQWRALWDEHTGGKDVSLPEVDFGKEAVVAVFAGQQRTGGYSVDVEVRNGSGNGLRVLYRIRPPKPDGFRLMMITQPFAIVKVARPAGALVLERASVPGPKFAGLPDEGLRDLRGKLADIQKAVSIPASLFD